MTIRKNNRPSGRFGMDTIRGTWGLIIATCALTSVSCIGSTGGDGSPSLPVGEETSELVVTPGTDLTSTGTQGGPFAAASITYTLENIGADPIDWTAAADQTWISLSSTGGQLDPGAMDTLIVSIDQAIAGALTVGNFQGVVTITDTGLAESVTRDVSLTVTPLGGGSSMGTSLSQFGITWQFSQMHEIGQFANGDWWVVGPVTITDITPRSTRVGGRTMNGSMLNPSPRNGQRQGYDSSMYGQYKTAADYDPAMNVALDVTASKPLVITTAASLVSTISVPTADARPQIDSASVLTVLMSPPAPGSFRPSYCGSDKTIRFNESQLNYSTLGKLAPVGQQFESGAVERMFERPWIDHVANWPGRYLHPAKAMQAYGRDLTSEVSIGAVVLNMNQSNAEKRTLMVRFTQLGIDFYGIAQDGGNRNWEPNQGHMSGRKWPILFAGIVLGDTAMGNVGFDTSIAFGEDGQTFYVAETSPGTYNFGFGGYTAADVGLEEWGGFHSVKPSVDDRNWYGDPYRLCCTANSWYGMLLAAHVMGAKALWNHDAIFDYQDRYIQENAARGVTGFQKTWHPFYFAMYQAYRSNY